MKTSTFLTAIKTTFTGALLGTAAVQALPATSITSLQRRTDGANEPSNTYLLMNKNFVVDSVLESLWAVPNFKVSSVELSKFANEDTKNEAWWHPADYPTKTPQSIFMDACLDHTEAGNDFDAAAKDPTRKYFLSLIAGVLDGWHFNTEHKLVVQCLMFSFPSQYGGKDFVPIKYIETNKDYTNDMIKYLERNSTTYASFKRSGTPSGSIPSLNRKTSNFDRKQAETSCSAIEKNATPWSRKH